MSPIQTLKDEVRPLPVYLAAFSFVINLLFLIPAIFTSQVFDRVLPSNSQGTLIVLLAGTAVALLILLGLDFIRTHLQHVVGNLIDERFAPPVVQAIVARAPHGGQPASVADVTALRRSSPTN